MIVVADARDGQHWAIALAPALLQRFTAHVESGDEGSAGCGLAWSAQAGVLPLQKRPLRCREGPAAAWGWPAVSGGVAREAALGCLPRPEPANPAPLTATRCSAPKADPWFNSIFRPGSHSEGTARLRR